MNYDQDRERLGFVRAIIEYIEPLLVPYGLRPTEASAYVIEFESANVKLSFTHDRLSYEIEVAFARKDAPSDVYTLQDLLDAQVGSANRRKGFFQASDPERTSASIKDIAALLMQYGGSALNGEATTYQRLRETRRSRAERYTKTIVQEPVRIAAEEAWQSHDYDRVRDLYASIKADLSAVERERLRYAQKKTNAENNGSEPG